MPEPVKMFDPEGGNLVLALLPVQSLQAVYALKRDVITEIIGPGLTRLMVERAWDEHGERQIVKMHIWGPVAIIGGKGGVTPPAWWAERETIPVV
jgi:hypothetical protein